MLKIFSHIPSIYTPRLELRKLSVRDSRDIYEYASQPLTTKYLLWDVHPSLDHTRQYLSYVSGKYACGEFFDWGVVLQESGKLIGTCGFVCFDLPNKKAEVGYVINPAYWNRGYATEALRAALSFGFEKLALHRVEARHMVGNEPSAAVMRKCEMRLEGTARQSMFVKNEYKDIVTYAILEQEFHRS
ncbi:MAG: GNAT family protein [Eubacteriales bacterium]